MNERERSMPGLMTWRLSPFLGLTGQREAVVPPELVVSVRTWCARREAGQREQVLPPSSPSPSLTSASHWSNHLEPEDQGASDAPRSGAGQGRGWGWLSRDFRWRITV